MCDTKTGSFFLVTKNEADIGGFYNWNELDMVFISFSSFGAQNTYITRKCRFL